MPFLIRMQTKLLIFMLIFLAAMALVVNRPALDNGFVADDTVEIIENNFVKSWTHLPDLWGKGYITSQAMLSLGEQTEIGSGSISYRPITTLTYFFDYAIWKLNPFGYHLTNLFLLVISGLLVYALGVRALSLTPIASVFAAAVFVLHPVNNEVTAVITSRDDSVAFIFFALSFLSYLKFRNQNFKQNIFYFLSLGCYALSLLSKEMAITLPLLLISYDFIFKSAFLPQFKNRLGYYGGYFLITAVYLWVWFFVAPVDRRDLVNYFGGQGFVIAGTLIQIIAQYFKWLIWPVKVPAALADEGILVQGFFSPVFLLSTVCVVLFGLFFVVSLLHRRKHIVFCLLWFVISLGPVLLLPYMLNVLYAARFLFIPMVGFCFLLGMLWDDLQKRGLWIRYLSYGLMVILFLFYSQETMASLPRWKDNLTLSMNRLHDYPNNTVVYGAIAGEFEKRGMFQEAFDVYQQTLDILPECIECHNQIGLLYLKFGDLQKAKEHITLARAMDPRYEVSQLNYCIVIGELKEYAQAETCYADMLKQPNPSIQVFYNYGVLLTREKKYLQARAIWEQGLRVDPHHQGIQKALKRLP